MSTPMPNPFITEPDSRFVPDMDALAAELEDHLRKHARTPKFLSDPSPAYLTAVDLTPIAEVLQRF